MRGGRRGVWPAVAAVVTAAGLVAVPAGAGTAAAPRAVTRWVSVALDGRQGFTHTENPVVAANGRFVAFDSGGAGLVRGDTNNASDVFVRDLRAARPERVSVGRGGAQANAGSRHPAISAGGRTVAFTSIAWNLVPGDSNAVSDVFVRDRRAGATSRVSVASSGGQADRHSYAGGISGDGRRVVFWSASTNLVAGDTNDAYDVFVRDRSARTTTRVSVAASGGQADGGSRDPVISLDGRWVAFSSEATNLVPGDTNGISDVFVRDLLRGTTARVSVGPGGAQVSGVAPYGGSSAPSLSGDGRWVAFMSTATGFVPGTNVNRVDAYVRDLRAGVTQRVAVTPSGGQAAGSQDGYGGYCPALAADGRWVAFATDASNLVPGDTNELWDVFVRDLRSRAVVRVSVGYAGQGNGGSGNASITADGRHVAFSSTATNLVRGPNTFLQEYADAYVRGPLR